MIRIAISTEAFEATARTMTLGSVGHANSSMTCMAREGRYLAPLETR